MLKLLVIAFVAAVPGCVPEVPAVGDLIVYNRTDDAITVTSRDSLPETTVGACGEMSFESIRLNEVRISQSGTNGAILNAPADPQTKSFVLVTANGAELTSEVPDPLPECEGRLP